MENNLIYWNILYTRPGLEKKISVLLSKKRIMNYCPCIKNLSSLNDKKNILFIPLFKSYVFVNFKLEKYHSIKEIEGVINFIYWLGKPAIISDTEILTIKEFLSTYDNISIEKIDVNMNDIIRITKGPYVITESKNGQQIINKGVKVTLPHLGYNIIGNIKNEIKNSNDLLSPLIENSPFPIIHY